MKNKKVITALICAVLVIALIMAAVIIGKNRSDGTEDSSTSTSADVSVRDIPTEKAEDSTEAPETDSETNTPGTSEKDETTQPVESSEPDGTAEPITTEKADTTSEPGTTEKLEVTSAPVETSIPDTTNNPEATEKPAETTKATETTKTTETTKASETTKPETSAEPQTTSEPEHTTEPEETTYCCGYANHKCDNPQIHKYICSLEEKGCKYCGSHSCPSFYGVDEWGCAGYNPTLCPQYNAHLDPTQYCQTCGKKCGDGQNGTCATYNVDVDCPFCGEHVTAWTCHSCKTN